MPPRCSAWLDEMLDCYDDPVAHRDVMFLMARAGRFSGDELWRDGRKVDECKSVKRGA
jgi:hypothetical protein